MLATVSVVWNDSCAVEGHIEEAIRTAFLKLDEDMTLGVFIFLVSSLVLWYSLLNVLNGIQPIMMKFSSAHCVMKCVYVCACVRACVRVSSNILSAVL